MSSGAAQVPAAAKYDRDITAGPAVTVRGLRKVYSGVAAVDGLDLEIRRGEIFALLGPNGAGKTTTVEILEGYRSRDAGEVTVLGVDPARDRARLKPVVGIVLQSTGVEPYLTVYETVTMYAGLYPHPRPVDEVIELTGLAGKRGERVVRLSGGQQRRLDLAIALAGDPDLLFLDEPTTGFDPSARREAWDVVRNLASLGKTVLLTTHYLFEADALCDRIGVIAKGTLLAEGTPAQLKARVADRTVVEIEAYGVTIDTIEELRRIPDVVAVSVEEREQSQLVRVQSAAGLTLTQTLLARFHDVRVGRVAAREPTLEDAYVDVVTQGAGA